MDNLSHTGEPTERKGDTPLEDRFYTLDEASKHLGDQDYSTRSQARKEFNETAQDIINQHIEKMNDSEQATFYAKLTRATRIVTAQKTKMSTLFQRKISSAPPQRGIKKQEFLERTKAQIATLQRGYSSGTSESQESLRRKTFQVLSSQISSAPEVETETYYQFLKDVIVPVKMDPKATITRLHQSLKGEKLPPPATLHLLIMEARFDGNLNSLDNTGKTALQLAIEKGASEEQVAFFLEKGADPWSGLKSAMETSRTDRTKVILTLIKGIKITEFQPPPVSQAAALMQGRVMEWLTEQIEKGRPSSDFVQLLKELIGKSSMEKPETCWLFLRLIKDLRWRNVLLNNPILGQVFTFQEEGGRNLIHYAARIVGSSEDSIFFNKMRGNSPSFLKAIESEDSLGETPLSLAIQGFNVPFILELKNQLGPDLFDGIFTKEEGWEKLAKAITSKPEKLSSLWELLNKLIGASPPEPKTLEDLFHLKDKQGNGLMQYILKEGRANWVPLIPTHFLLDFAKELGKDSGELFLSAIKDKLFVNAVLKRLKENQAAMQLLLESCLPKAVTTLPLSYEILQAMQENTDPAIFHRLFSFKAIRGDSVFSLAIKAGNFPLLNDLKRLDPNLFVSLVDDREGAILSAMISYFKENPSAFASRDGKMDMFQIFFSPDLAKQVILTGDEVFKGQPDIERRFEKETNFSPESLYKWLILFYLSGERGIKHPPGRDLFSNILNPECIKEVYGGNNLILKKAFTEQLKFELKNDLQNLQMAGSRIGEAREKLLAKWSNIIHSLKISDSKELRRLVLEPLEEEYNQSFVHLAVSNDVPQLIHLLDDPLLLEAMRQPRKDGLTGLQRVILAGDTKTAKLVWTLDKRFFEDEIRNAHKGDGRSLLHVLADATQYSEQSLDLLKTFLSPPDLDKLLEKEDQRHQTPYRIAFDTQNSLFLAKSFPEIGNEEFFRLLVEAKEKKPEKTERGYVSYDPHDSTQAIARILNARIPSDLHPQEALRWMRFLNLLGDEGIISEISKDSIFRILQNPEVWTNPAFKQTAMKFLHSAIHKKIELNQPLQREIWQPILDAIQKADPSSLHSWLEFTDENGNNLLHLLAPKDHTNLGWLLEWFSKHVSTFDKWIGSVNKSGKTPCLIAISNNQLENLKIMLASTPEQLRRPENYFAQQLCQSKINGELIVHLLARENRVDSLKILQRYAPRAFLEAITTESDDRGEKSTPLRFAIRQRQDKVIEVLLSHLPKDIPLEIRQSDLIQEKYQQMDFITLPALLGISPPLQGIFWTPKLLNQLLNPTNLGKFLNETSEKLKETILIGALVGSFEKYRRTGNTQEAANVWAPACKFLIERNESSLLQALLTTPLYKGKLGDWLMSIGEANENNLLNYLPPTQLISFLEKTNILEMPDESLVLLLRRLPKIREGLKEEELRKLDDILTSTERGFSLAHRAAEMGLVEYFDCISRERQLQVLSSRDQHGRTPIYYAAIRGHKNFFDRLQDIQRIGVESDEELNRLRSRKKVYENVKQRAINEGQKRQVENQIANLTAEIAKREESFSLDLTKIDLAGTDLIHLIVQNNRDISCLESLYRLYPRFFNQMLFQQAKLKQNPQDLRRLVATIAKVDYPELHDYLSQNYQLSNDQLLDFLRKEIVNAKEGEKVITILGYSDLLGLKEPLTYRVEIPPSLLALFSHPDASELLKIAKNSPEHLKAAISFLIRYSTERGKVIDDERLSALTKALKHGFQVLYEAPFFQAELTNFLSRIDNIHENFAHLIALSPNKKLLETLPKPLLMAFLSQTNRYVDEKGKLHADTPFHLATIIPGELKKMLDVLDAIVDPKEKETIAAIPHLLCDGRTVFNLLALRKGYFAQEDLIALRNFSRGSFIDHMSKFQTYYMRGLDDFQEYAIRLTPLASFLNIFRGAATIRPMFEILGYDQESTEELAKFFSPYGDRFFALDTAQRKEAADHLFKNLKNLSPFKKMEIALLLGSKELQDLVLQETESSMERIVSHPKELLENLVTSPQATRLVLQCRDSKGNNFLHYAISKPEMHNLIFDMAKLDKKLIDDLLMSSNKKGETPLHIAAQGGHLLLFEKILDILKSPSGEMSTAFKSLPKQGVVEVAARNNKELARWILEKIEKPILMKKYHSYNALLGRQGKAYFGYPFDLDKWMKQRSQLQRELATIRKEFRKNIELMDAPASQQKSASFIKPTFLPLDREEIEQFQLVIDSRAEGQELPNPRKDPTHPGVQDCNMKVLYQFYELALTATWVYDDGKVINCIPEFVNDDGQWVPRSKLLYSLGIRLNALRNNETATDAYGGEFSRSFQDKIITTLQYVTWALRKKQNEIDLETDPKKQKVLQKELFDMLNNVFVEGLGSASFHCLDRWSQECERLYSELVLGDQPSVRGQIMTLLVQYRQNIVKESLSALPSIRDIASTQRYYMARLGKELGLGTTELSRTDSDRYLQVVSKGHEDRIRREFRSKYNPKDFVAFLTDHLNAPKSKLRESVHDWFVDHFHMPNGDEDFLTKDGTRWREEAVATLCETMGLFSIPK